MIGWRPVWGVTHFSPKVSSLRSCDPNEDKHSRKEMDNLHKHRIKAAHVAKCTFVDDHMMYQWEIILGIFFFAFKYASV